MVRKRYNDRFVRFCCCFFFLVVVVLTCHVHWCSPETATKTNNAENYHGHKHTGPNASNHAAAPVINEEHYIDHILLIKTHFEFKKILHVLRVKLAMQKKALWKAKIKRIDTSVFLMKMITSILAHLTLSQGNIRVFDPPC